jgi:hypothetical protein
VERLRAAVTPGKRGMGATAGALVLIEPTTPPTPPAPTLTGQAVRDQCVDALQRLAVPGLPEEGGPKKPIHWYGLLVDGLRSVVG